MQLCFMAELQMEERGITVRKGGGKEVVLMKVTGTVFLLNHVHQYFAKSRGFSRGKTGLES